MLRGGRLVREYHPDEFKVLDLHWDINRRYETIADRPNMEWYLTD